jgi:hypothetical protein
LERATEERLETIKLVRAMAEGEKEHRERVQESFREGRLIAYAVLACVIVITLLAIGETLVVHIF